MGEVTTIGLDLAKRVFQAHGVDAASTVVLERQMRRAELLRFFGKLPRCLIGLEACATAHYWGRELAALGHEVRLIPPHYVKPYVRRNKSDRAMRRPFARRSVGRRCGSCRSKTPRSRQVWWCIGCAMC